jgi:hypothetical protein
MEYNNRKARCLAAWMDAVRRLRVFDVGGLVVETVLAGFLGLGSTALALFDLVLGKIVLPLMLMPSAKHVKPTRKQKDPAAVALGRKGGKKRAENMSRQERADLAKKAATARWSRAKRAKRSAPRP